jgi:hypothetical protein
MTRASLQAIRRTITIDWKNKAEADAKALLLKTAREGNARTLAEQTARAGVKPGVIAYANSVGNANLDSVKLPGPIVFNYRYFTEIVQETVKALIAASPRDSGDYIRGHTVFIDGSPVQGVPTDIGPNVEIIIANRVPYARKIEVGKTKKGRAFVIQVEPHIYERVMSQVIRPKYRTVAKIAFNYVSLPDAYESRKGPMRYPAILIGPLA